MPHIQDIHVRKIARRNHLSWPVDWPKLSHLLLLPWYTAITDYTSSVNSNSQQQLMARWTNKQIATRSESDKKSENHHKWNKCMTFQVY